ncbi:MAG: alpha/beta hydrolase [Caulobacterales bacterium]
MAAIGQQKLERVSGPTLRYSLQDGANPALVWLGGFKSDMTGTKAEALAAWAKKRGQAFLRFDYSGHGASDGEFKDFTIGQARRDTLDVIDKIAPRGSLLLIGSSMGAWLALHAALARADRIAALLLIAPATDFTAKLMEPGLDAEAKRQIAEQGFWMRPSQYEAPYPITRALLEDGRKHQLLDAPIAIGAPVRILQGQQDPDVPWRHALLTAERLSGGDVETILIKDGDHRLSRSRDIARMLGVLEDLLKQTAPPVRA